MSTELLTDYFAGRIDLSDAELMAILPKQEQTLAEFVAQLESGEPIEFSDILREAAAAAIRRREMREPITPEANRD